ncbi:MAG TPA: tRNA (adenosine(37)-N6)-threonylcarbamoyltransferase complex ATPase subunit type 1 TsaE [Gemmatimonadaceae bacterium]|nr:tRNA (adenosine(37)-N6)-threonylcarbamoyltransferase complex ATPase subunit type 1 TsaE [Gemmatimonadaceae bacterium]
MHRHFVPPLAERGRLTLEEHELRDWGADLGRSASPPLLISLSGDLGAGKTTLAQAICSGYGVTDEVTSPTYALVHRYESARSPVYHVDLYRLSDERDLTNIGWDDLLGERALVIVEWPERAGNRMPSDHLHIDLEYITGDETRRVVLAG